jgi:hypothetical protein
VSSSFLLFFAVAAGAPKSLFRIGEFVPERRGALPFFFASQFGAAAHRRTSSAIFPLSISATIF